GKAKSIAAVLEGLLIHEDRKYHGVVALNTLGRHGEEEVESLERACYGQDSVNQDDPSVHWRNYAQEDLYLARAVDLSGLDQVDVNLLHIGEEDDHEKSGINPNEGKADRNHDRIRVEHHGERGAGVAGGRLNQSRYGAVREENPPP